MRTVNRFNVSGTVSNAYISSVDPLGNGTLPTTWLNTLLYYFASYVGVYTDNSANHAYSGSKYNGTYNMSVSANSRWNNFLYNSDRTNNGCGFTLFISNNNNRLPTIRVNTSMSIYESLIGYILLNGPTLYY